MVEKFSCEDAKKDNFSEQMEFRKKSNLAIGIFDSGFGGLTVMKAIRDLLPSENLIYFGDTAHLPYGTKSKETILRYSLQNASFLIEQGIKVLVVACHTASCLALEELQHRFSIPIIGVTTPTIEEIVRLSAEKICLIGTHGTVASGIYQSSLQKLLPHAEMTAIPCQLLVHLVEEGFMDHPVTEMTLRQYLAPLERKEIDTIVLGCTHFPLLQDQIKKVLNNPQVKILDPATYCAASLKKLLEALHLLHPTQSTPTDQFFVSDNPKKFRQLGAIFLQHPLENVISVNN